MVFSMRRKSYHWEHGILIPCSFAHYIILCYIYTYLYLVSSGEYLALALNITCTKQRIVGVLLVCRTFLSSFPFPAFWWETNRKINISDQKLEERHESRWAERGGVDRSRGSGVSGFWLSRKRRQNFHPSVTMCQVTGCQNEATSYIIFLPSPAPLPRTTSAFFPLCSFPERERQFVEIN